MKKARIAGAFVALAAIASVLATAGGATTRGKNGLIVYAVELRPEHFQLFTIRPEGSGRKQITGGATTGAANPDWSSDGQRIVFERQTRNSAGIATMSANGTGVRILTPKGFQGQPSFSPDGKQVVYERDIAQGNNGVWIMRADGTELRRVTRNPFMLGGECGCDTDPNFSPDGKLITFVRIKKDHDLQALFAVRPDGSGLRQLTPYSWEVAVKHDWSPDGKQILLTTNADFVVPGGSANMVTVKPDGSGKKQLTNFTGGSKNAFAGSFSPDGKKVVFRLEDGEKYSVAVINLATRQITRLTTSSEKPRFLDWGTHP
jgi:Tol biopolymer transport system component